MKILLVRHGETVTSGQTYAGRSDVPLNDRGRAQAARLAQKLGHRSLCCIISSPLSRAMDTARPIAGLKGLSPVPDPGLMELDFGEFEGRNKSDLGLAMRKEHALLPLPGGESLHDVWVRAGKVLGRLTARGLETDAACMLVGHFWINRLIWGQASGMNFEAACRSRDYRPRTGSTIEISVPASRLYRGHGQCLCGCRFRGDYHGP